MNKYWEEREKMNQMYNAPQYRRLKYAALSVAAVVAILLLIIAFGGDKISLTTELIIQGFAGLGAVVFAVLIGTLTYRANKEHIANRRK